MSPDPAAVFGAANEASGRPILRSSHCLARRRSGRVELRRRHPQPADRRPARHVACHGWLARAEGRDGRAPMSGAGSPRPAPGAKRYGFGVHRRLRAGSRRTFGRQAGGTHWASCERLAKNFPALEVDDRLALRSLTATSRTSAGVTTPASTWRWLWVEADLGAAVANH